MAEVRKQLEIKRAAEYNSEELKLKFKDVLEFQRQMKETEKVVKTGSSDSVENKVRFTREISIVFSVRHLFLCLFSVSRTSKCQCAAS